MTISTCDVPENTFYLRRAYLYDLEKVPDPEFCRCMWFAIHSWRGRALDCIVMTDEGMVRDQLPISALCTKPHPEHIPLDYLELWNAFGERVTAIEYAYLSGLRCETILKDGSVHQGRYLFTVDWYGEPQAIAPGDEGRKSGHVLALDCGCIAVQPNNRLVMREASFATKGVPLPEMRKKGYRVNTHAWEVERTGKWVTEDSDQFFYEVKKSG